MLFINSGSNRKPFRQKGTGMARQGQKEVESLDLIQL